jgi:putative hydrolase of the HAD superfamily
MVQADMKIRAAIFDIYKTLLEVLPPPADASERWKILCSSTFGDEVRTDFNQFTTECEKVITREHAAARAIGIVNPEIYWPAIAGEVLPELKKLSHEARGEFLYQHAQLQRTVRLMEGAAEVLKRLMEKKISLGIVSNSQPYTLRELDAALATANLSRTIFKPELSFLSFENGFSKPNPHVFRLLTARLNAAGIVARETIVIGDRLDNDIEPARAAGFQTWHLNGAGENSGNWNQFMAQTHR